MPGGPVSPSLRENEPISGELVTWEVALLFNVEFDHGDVIEGYLIPDGFSDRPIISVSGEAGELMRVECAHARPAVVQSGRHETGIVGFRLDREIFPDLVTCNHLEIRDSRSGVLVYRRPVEIRSKSRDERALLVHEVVVEQVADLLGLSPESVDPRYGES